MDSVLVDDVLEGLFSPAAIATHVLRAAVNQFLNGEVGALVVLEEVDALHRPGGSNSPATSASPLFLYAGENAIHGPQSTLCGRLSG
jgi:hypothetical protein